MQKLILEIEKYIEKYREAIFIEDDIVSDKTILESVDSIELEDFIKNKRQSPFNELLFSYIDKKATSDSIIYKKAGLDRKHFSKIRSKSNYRPKKNTVIALALALELNKKETDKLLDSAGYSLSYSDTYDLVIQFFLEKNIYDIDLINQALDHFSLKPIIGLS